MIPDSHIPSHEAGEPPDVTWRLDEENISSDKIDGLLAVRQAVALILRIERCRYIIYSWDYGIEIEDLFGQPISFVKPQLERRIRDALLQDTRITGVNGFIFAHKGKTLQCRFTVHTIYGDTEEEFHVRANHI